MYISTKYLHVFLDIGDALLSSGAEIFRVEDTLNRMGYACGATQMNVFVITSSIVITMEFPEENVRTQTRRIRKTGGNDFEKLEKLNNLSLLKNSGKSSIRLTKLFRHRQENSQGVFWQLLALHFSMEEIFGMHYWPD